MYQRRGLTGEKRESAIIYNKCGDAAYRLPDDFILTVVSLTLTGLRSATDYKHTKKRESQPSDMYLQSYLDEMS